MYFPSHTDSSLRNNIASKKCTISCCKFSSRASTLKPTDATDLTDQFWHRWHHQPGFHSWSCTLRDTPPDNHLDTTTICRTVIHIYVLGCFIFPLRLRSALLANGAHKVHISTRSAPPIIMRQWGPLSLEWVSRCGVLAYMLWLRHCCHGGGGRGKAGGWGGTYAFSMTFWKLFVHEVHMTGGFWLHVLVVLRLRCLPTGGSTSACVRHVGEKEKPRVRRPPPPSCAYSEGEAAEENSQAGGRVLLELQHLQGGENPLSRCCVLPYSICCFSGVAPRRTPNTECSLIPDEASPWCITRAPDGFARWFSRQFSR